MRAGLRRAFTVWRSRFSRSPGFLSREAQLLANLGFADVNEKGELVDQKTPAFKFDNIFMVAADVRAWTFDKETDKTCAYLDGETIRCDQHDPGSVGNIDCDKTGPDAYFGFGHRMPGALQPEGVLQDARYYRELLTPAEIRKLASESVDEDGISMRSCELSSEGGDTDWTDINGKDCAWYQERKKTVPTI